MSLCRPQVGNNFTPLFATSRAQIVEIPESSSVIVRPHVPRAEQHAADASVRVCVREYRGIFYREHAGALTEADADTCTAGSIKPRCRSANSRTRGGGLSRCSRVCSMFLILIRPINLPSGACALAGESPDLSVISGRAIRADVSASTSASVIQPIDESCRRESTLNENISTGGARSTSSTFIFPRPFFQYPSNDQDYPRIS